MRSAARSAAVAVAAVAVLLGLPDASVAHPLGQSSVNHVTYVTIERDRIELLYILDEAEIPTYQQRNLSNQELISDKVREVRRNLIVEVDGERLVPRLTGEPDLDSLVGQGGLPTTLFELPLEVGVERSRYEAEVSDKTFTDFDGLVSMQAAPGEGTAVQLGDEQQADPTGGLRDYSEVDRDDILVDRSLSFGVGPGEGVLTAPSGEQLRVSEAPAEEAAAERPGTSDPFADLFEDAAAGEGAFVLFLLAAFGWGALHALSPGHGKAMVAAYLAATRGGPRDAIALGAIVTVTHTAGVFALGLVTLLLAQYILPEDLYPWLNLISGLLIVAVGVGVLRSRLRWARTGRHGAPPSPDGHTHPEGEGDEAHPHGHAHGEHDHHHGPATEPEATQRGLLGMGVSAGIVPCPSALVVLLAAISQAQVGLGLILIVAFSLGLASTLTALGLVIVYGKRIGSRVASPRVSSSWPVRVLPLASNLVILGLGLVLTANAIPDLA